MKTNIPAPLLRFVLLASLAIAPLAPAAEDEGSTAAVKLSAPDKPATFNLDVPWADIRITGTDGDTVTVESTLNQKNTKPARPGDRPPKARPAKGSVRGSGRKKF